MTEASSCARLNSLAASLRCVITESLELATSPEPITHPRVGKYFEQFADTHYKLNAETAAKYPDDQERTLQTIGNFLSANKDVQVVYS